MAATTTKSVKLTLAFEDATTRTITFSDDNFNFADLADRVKTKVRTLNAGLPATFVDTFISKNGFAVVKISKAQFLTKSSEVIYSAS